MPSCHTPRSFGRFPRETKKQTVVLAVFIFMTKMAAPNRKPIVSRGSPRSEEHTSELQSLMRISYAVFCLNKKKQYNTIIFNIHDKITHSTVNNILSISIFINYN